MERLGLETRPARLGSRYNPLNLLETEWPTTKENDWCGEYVRDLSKIGD